MVREGVKPLVGKLAELADTVTALVRIIELIGEAGYAALPVASIVEDPPSALIDIMSSTMNFQDPWKVNQENPPSCSRLR